MIGKILDIAKSKLVELLRDKNMWDIEISVLARALTPEEAIGTPGRRDFPIIIGKERMLEAKLLDARGQAFTDSRKEFIGTLRQVFELPLINNSNRAIFVATMNAILRNLGICDSTIHCKNNEPEICAVEIADFIYKKIHPATIGLIGLNPAIAEALTNKFDSKNVQISDRNLQNIGSRKFGVEIVDGNSQNDKLIENSDFVLITGTTIVNDTFDGIMKSVRKHNRKYILYGVTASGISSLFDMPRICPYSK